MQEETHNGNRMPPHPDYADSSLGFVYTWIWYADGRDARFGAYLMEQMAGALEEYARARGARLIAQPQLDLPAPARLPRQAQREVARTLPHLVIHPASTALARGGPAPGTVGRTHVRYGKSLRHHLPLDPRPGRGKSQKNSSRLPDQNPGVVQQGVCPPISVQIDPPEGPGRLGQLGDQLEGRGVDQLIRPLGIALNDLAQERPQGAAADAS
ncbi:hypothetical protein ACGRHY_26575 [Streptomyces sp. HK10]|uniref:hypothetical protein n=1 Tax=Streptomyces sp. HK10 TaxID=3373255 RepID=UPI0037482E17